MAIKEAKVQIKRAAKFPSIDQLVPGADLRKYNLSGMHLSGIDLRGANLSDANLTKTNLSDANLEDANLTGAIMKEINLRGANLKYAVLDEADLRQADLRRTNLTGATFYDTNHRGIDISGSTGYTGQKLYDDHGEDWDPFHGYPAGPVPLVKDNQKTELSVLYSYMIAPVHHPVYDVLAVIICLSSSLINYRSTKMNLTRVSLLGANLVEAKLHNANLILLELYLRGFVLWNYI